MKLALGITLTLFVVMVLVVASFVLPPRDGFTACLRSFWLRVLVQPVLLERFARQGRKAVQTEGQFDHGTLRRAGDQS